jgi:outer membrane lipoprotein
MKRYLILLCLLLSACSSLPPAIENAPEIDISYKQAQQNIANYKNAKVRWGGVIVDVENEQNSSLVQVLLYPLNGYGRPKLDKPSEGRFLIKSHEFLDPAVYEKDTELTVAGTLLEEVERKIGNKTLRLPVIASQIIHRWPKFELRNDYNVPGYGFGGFGYGYYPYYGGAVIYPYYPSRRWPRQ